MGAPSTTGPRTCGLPLGGYLSHWSGGLYLNGLDHFVKRTLKITGYLRYMDDFSLFADERGRLESAREAIRDWLASERRLELKPRNQSVQPTREPSTYLGFRVSRAGLGMGPKAKRRLQARLRATKRGSSNLDQLERSLRSLQGMLRLA
ncbi:MAG: RNA-directed DNA polymerase [Proteobacteria bacterium]|nr:RNA-directed DNA polymerase [Pseudomonadota bacterium]